MSTALLGSGPLLRVARHQDARNIAPWVAIVTGLSASSVLAYPWVFPTAESRAQLETTIGTNPALGLIFGQARDLSTVDGFNVWRVLALGGFFTALMAIFTVVRNSRAHEDSGQAELLASGALGRSSRLAVAVALALGGSLAAGVVAATVTVLLGGDPATSALLGATFTATGWMFAGVAAVTSQLGSDARTATSLAVATLGVLFVVRGYLDSVDAAGWTAWITPLGWMHETRPATDADLGPLGLALAFTAAALAVAFALQSRRDFAMGAVAPRPGPARGTARSVWRLALRLNRGPLLAWTVACVGLGVVFGNVATSVGDLLAANPGVGRILAAGATTQDALVFRFLMTVLALVGIIAAVSGAQSVVRVRTEELDHRVDPVLATAVRRPAYLASTVLVALAGPTLGMLVAGTTIALVAGRADVGLAAGDVVLATLATIPAVWALVAVAVAVVGARPQVRLAAWVGVVVSFGLTLLGPTFVLDDRVLGISPLWHVPDVSAAAPDWSGLVWVGGATAVLLAVGFLGFRRRDVA
jgi:ABC-2 type transport system permease protein